MNNYMRNFNRGLTNIRAKMINKMIQIVQKIFTKVGVGYIMILNQPYDADQNLIRVYQRYSPIKEHGGIIMNKAFASIDYTMTGQLNHDKLDMYSIAKMMNYLIIRSYLGLSTDCVYDIWALSFYSPNMISPIQMPDRSSDHDVYTLIVRSLVGENKDMRFAVIAEVPKGYINTIDKIKIYDPIKSGPSHMQFKQISPYTKLTDLPNIISFDADPDNKSSKSFVKILYLLLMKISQNRI